MVQESALTALASTADNAQAAFAKYYGTVLPYLKQILINAEVGPGRYHPPRHRYATRTLTS